MVAVLKAHAPATTPSRRARVGPFLLATPLVLSLAQPGLDATSYLLCPSAGIALGALFRYRVRSWPVLLAGAVLAGVTETSQDRPLAASAAFAAVTTAGVVLTYMLLRHLGFPDALVTTADLRRLVVFGAGAGMGTTALARFGFLVLSGCAEPAGAVSWWLPADWSRLAAGVLIGTPLVLLRPRPRWRQTLVCAGGLPEAAVVLGLCAAAAFLAARHGNLGFLIFPLPLWAGMRFRMPGAVLGVWVTCAVLATSSSTLAEGGRPAAVLCLGCVAVALTALTTGVAVQERDQSYARQADALALMVQTAGMIARTLLRGRTASPDRGSPHRPVRAAAMTCVRPRPDRSVTTGRRGATRVPFRVCLCLSGLSVVVTVAGLGVLATQVAGISDADTRPSPAGRTGATGGSLVPVAESAARTVVTVGRESETGPVIGSGIIVSPDGLILTNLHVAGTDRSADSLTTRLPGGPAMKTRLVAVDPHHDLALLRAAAPTRLHSATLAGSGRLRVGSPIVAYGASDGLQGTFTEGVVSGLDRSVSEIIPYRRTRMQVVIRNAIQIDALVQPGNSGGALLDARGRTVGVVTAMDSDGGFGFAIPISAAAGLLALRDDTEAPG